MIRTPATEARLSDAFWPAGCDRAERLGRQLGELAQQLDRPDPGLGAIDRNRSPDDAALSHRRGRHGTARRLRTVEQVASPSTALKIVDGGGLLRVQGPLEQRLKHG